MHRTGIAKFVIAVGGITVIVGIVMLVWAVALRSTGKSSVGNPSCMFFPVGFAMSAAIMRWLFPAIAPNGSSAKLLRACIVILAIGIAPFGMIDYDLVSAFSPLAWQDSNKVSGYLRPDVVAYSALTVGLWAAFVCLCLWITKVIASRLAPPGEPKFQKAVFLMGAFLFLVGLMGFQMIRLVVPRLGLLWKGNAQTGQVMTNAIAGMAKYAFLDGAVLLVAGSLLLVAGIGALRTLTPGICRKCGYPMHSTRCPECGETQPPPTSPPKH